MSQASDFVGMEPLPANINIYAGATFKKVFTWRDAANAVIDLTSCTGRMTVRDHGQVIPQAGAQSTPIDNIIIALTNGAGVALGGGAGTVTVTMTSATTTALPTGTYAYDLEVVTGAAEVIRLFGGAARVFAEETR